MVVVETVVVVVEAAAAVVRVVRDGGRDVRGGHDGHVEMNK